jgi:UDP:flavonoid glycosyltransferase YjiC (YdhE family)
VRVLLTSFGSYGDLNPYLGLGQALAARGHEAVLATSELYRRHVEDAGLQFRPIRPNGDPNDHATIARIMDPVRGAEFLVRQVLMPRLKESYDDLLDAARDVDVIVSHPLTFAAPVVAGVLKKPWASSVLSPLNFFSKADPPLVAPSAVLAAVHRRWPRAYAQAISIGQLFTRTWGEPVQALRRSVGLPRGGHPVYAGQFSPHLTLALFSSVLAEPQSDWPPNTVVTGAVRFDAVHGGLPSDLARFLDDGPAPAVFTLGSAAVSVRRAPHFYDVSVAAAKSLGLRAVLLVGRVAGNRPAVVSDDVFIAEWAPHSELFPRAACVVHQGGAGTLHTTLAAGRPMLVVPFAHDQPDNAARVERLGVARVIYPTQYSAWRVHRELETLLADPDVRDRTQTLGEVVRAEDAGATATERLSQLHASVPRRI